MSEYARICVNMPKSAGMAFLLHVYTEITCLLERVVTYFNKVYSLMEQEAVYLQCSTLQLFYSGGGGGGGVSPSGEFKSVRTTCKNFNLFSHIVSCSCSLPGEICLTEIAKMGTESNCKTQL